MAASNSSQSSARKAIDLLLRPKSIAFVGASSDPTKQSGQPVRNVVAAGFEGKVYAVNRRAITGLAELRAATDGLASGNPVVLEVERGGELIYLSFMVD